MSAITGTISTLSISVSESTSTRTPILAPLPSGKLPGSLASLTSPTHQVSRKTLLGGTRDWIDQARPSQILAAARGEVAKKSLRPSRAQMSQSQGFSSSPMTYTQRPGTPSSPPASHSRKTTLASISSITEEDCKAI